MVFGVALGMLAYVIMPVMSGVAYADTSTPEARTGGAQRIDANNLKWIPVSETNPLGGADDFSAILFTEFKDFHETGAPVATRKVNNVNIVTFGEGLVGGINRYADYTIPKYNIGLITKEHTGKKTKVLNGDAIIGYDDVAQTSLELSGTTGSYIKKSNDEIEKFFV